MPDNALSEQFRDLYTQWGDAIANQRHEWLEGFFTDDFLGTAQPWPSLNVNRQQMIDLDKAVEAMDTEWIRVCAHRFGDEVADCRLDVAAAVIEESVAVLCGGQGCAIDDFLPRLHTGD